MRRFFLILGCVVLASCQYGSDPLKTVMDDPITILEDPLTVEHKQAMADLERAYVKKEITYAEYLEQKQELEDDYTKAVQQRENWIE